MKAIGRQSFLIVFDFDHTVVNCNTDEVIPRALSPPLTAVQHTMKNKLGMQWTKIMDCLCSTYTKEEMTAAAKESIELDPDMPAVFEYLLEAKYRYPVKEDAIPTGTSDQKAQHRVPGFLEINIASDANTMFIDASLDAVLPFLKNHVSQIHSNPYYELKEAGAEAGREVCYGGDNTHNTNADDEKERDALFKELYEATAAKAGEKEKLITDFTRKSRVCWYEPKGHDCPCCLHRGKPNMCKTKIIQRIMNTTALLDYTIIFVGDGANDYCPILNLLRPRDYMFARRDFPIHEILSTPIDEKGGNIVGGCCQIGLWKDAKELLQLFQTAIDHPTQGRLPTLSRFRDLNLHNSGLEEFRAVTLKKRCGDAIHRTVKALSDSNNGAQLSEAARKEIELLVEEVSQNKCVRPLPGQYQVDRWLQNYAYVAEDTTDPHAKVTDRASVVENKQGYADSNRFVTVAPRWGQVPFLHGEIYFYHLFWQILRMHHSEAELEKAKASLDPSKTETFAINTVSPYAMDHPFESQETLLEKGAVGTDGFVVAPAAPHQTVASTESIFTKPLLNRDGIEIQWQHNGASKDTVAMERIPLESILPPAKNNLIPVTDKQTVAPHFTPYQDIFRYEKVEVTSHFIQTRHLTKMIVCAPWEMHYTDPANEQFARTLCSWLLWGNGVDSSMFSPEELRQRLKEQNKKGEKEDGGKQQSGITVEDLRNICRQDEITLNEKKNANVIQNDIPGIVAYLVKHFEKVHASKDGHLVNKIDIVMDNTGVESVADLCFALWFLQNADHPVTKPKVVFHVKPMPYYISDVTPRDFELVFSLLRQEMEKLSATTGESEEERQYNTFIKDQLARFITLAEGYLANGQMVIDADIVWTMPCEVRELPPRIINAYFYTQHIHKHATPEENLRSEVSIFNESSPITSLHQCNKDVIIPKSVLVVFKGDLNYRRVLGDRHWNRIDFNTSNVYSHDDNTESLLHYTFLQDELFQDTPEADDATDPAPGTAVFRNSLSSIVGRYWPIREVPVVTVRTMKSEVSAGVPQAVKLAEDSRQGANPTWRTNGQYGVILLAH